MKDTSVLHIGENSPEQVAYKLMRDIGQAEGYFLVHASPKPSREWLIKTYCACLTAVRVPAYPKDSIALLPDTSS